MKRIVLMVLMTVSVMTAVAQTNRTFKGKVFDTAYAPMRDVSVCIYKAKDTSLINFAFTTPNGNYNINIKEKDSVIIIFSLMGFDDVVEKFEEKEGWSYMQLPDIKLKPAPMMIQGVKIRASAIRMKGDTIEINASRFKVMPGSDVAQLFKKIPGFEVNVKGEIKVNGNSVSKILVDGSDFFGNNPGLVSKNLNADMIETVQVYEENKETGGNISEEGQTSVINLKLKKGKRNGLFGDAMAGYGTEKRYETGLRLNSFKNDRKISFIVNGNNTNETGFDFGFDNWHRASGASKNTSSNDYFYYSGNNYETEGNLNKKVSGGFTYFNEFSKNRKLSFNVFADRNVYNSINFSQNITALNDSSNRNFIDSNILNGLSNNLSADVNYTKKIDSTGYFEIRLETSFAKVNSTNENSNSISFNNALINRSFSLLKDDINNNSSEFGISYDRYLRKNKKYRFGVSSTLKSDNNDNLSKQFNSNFNDTFNNSYNKTTKLQEFLVKVEGTMPIYKKLLFHLDVDKWIQENNANFLSQSATNRQNQSFEQSYALKIDSLSTVFKSVFDQQSVKSYLSYYDKGSYFTAGATLMQLNLESKNELITIDKPYTAFLPFIRYNFYNSKKYFRVSINKNVNFPKVHQLMPILNLNDNFNRNIGNVNLKPEEVYDFNTYFSIYKNKYVEYLGLSMRGSFTNNAIISNRFQNNEGIINNQLVNINRKEDVSGSIYVSKKLSSIFKTSLSSSQYYRKNPFIINFNNGFNTSNTNDLGLNLIINYSDSLELSFGANQNYIFSKNSLNPLNNFNQTTYSYSINFRTILRFGMEINSDFSLADKRNVPNIGQFIPVWSASLQQPLDKKGQFNLKLTAYDILNQNVSVSRSVYENSIFISEENRLRQYFMLTLLYKIRKVNSNQDESQSVW